MMNIQQAKETIKQTIQAYLLKDESGEYKIPSVRQRPVLLMGPPGIGKTAIMEQVARECHIGLVAYTITHHTRQSAIGLPYIVHKNFGGKDYAMTEYTMSEIIASVYEKMEATGLKEGILFIDEINCVSETLAPTMLQFLQGKTFGNHQVPKGWIIVAAGNPPQYNKSVKDFDIVTLDRVKRVDVCEDYEAWKSYGYSHHIHGAVMTYLEIKKENFYAIETTVDGRRFVTARGWEDLSEMIKAYEQLELPVTEELVMQYVQHSRIAKDFANYYDLYKKYETQYHVEEILDGCWSEAVTSQLKEAAFDEKVSMIGLLTSRLNEAFKEACDADSYTDLLYAQLKQLKDDLSRETEQTGLEILEHMTAESGSRMLCEKESGLLDRDQARIHTKVVKTLEYYGQQCRMGGIKAADGVFETVRTLFGHDVSARSEIIEQTSKMLHQAFAFLEDTFGESQEMVIFMTELNMDAYAVKFIGDNGSEDYYKYNKTLLFGENRKKILAQIDSVPVSYII